MGAAGDQRTFDLNVAACRLILDIMPGLDTSAVFQVIVLQHKLTATSFHLFFRN